MFTPTSIWTPGIASLSPNSLHSKLSHANISDEDYAHAQQVWATFGCKTLGDYSDCRTDVLLLVDVFETFRKTCLRQYGLDPAQYYTSPGISWNALLKKTDVELELLTDYDQHLSVEKGMRKGISMVQKHHVKANNPLVDGHDPEKPRSNILYLDANNLYGWAMSQYLPTGGFRCVHDRQQLAKMWTSECQNNLQGVGVAPTEVERLVQNLHNKDRYLLHYRNLQLYMSLGMRLAKVHRALRFDLNPWMEPYIWMNTELRKKATSDFKKELYKLMNYSVFTKTMENLRKRVDVKLVRSHE